jgi:hypothetical protein
LSTTKAEDIASSGTDECGELDQEDEGAGGELGEESDVEEFCWNNLLIEEDDNDKPLYKSD